MPQSRFFQGLFLSSALFALFAAPAAFAVDSSLTRSFNDIDATSPYFWSFEINHDLGIITGDSPSESGAQTSVRPTDSINRAEVMAILLRRLEAELGQDIDVSTYQNCFPDVSNQWFAGPICYAKEQGWVDGYPDGYFHPDREVIQAEYWKMLLNTAGYEADVEELISIWDGSYEWYEPYVMAAQQNNLNPGNGSIIPGDASDRQTVSDSSTRTLIEVLEILSEEEGDNPPYSSAQLEEFVEGEGLPLQDDLEGSLRTQWEEHVEDTAELAYDEVAASTSSVDKTELDFNDRELFCGTLSKSINLDYDVLYEDGSGRGIYQSTRSITLNNVQFDMQYGLLYFHEASGTAFVNVFEQTITDEFVSTYRERGQSNLSVEFNENSDAGSYNFDADNYLTSPPEFEFQMRLENEAIPVYRTDNYRSLVDPSLNRNSTYTVGSSLFNIGANSYSESSDGYTYTSTGDLLGSGSYTIVADHLTVDGAQEIVHVNWNFRPCGGSSPDES